MYNIRQSIRAFHYCFMIKKVFILFFSLAVPSLGNNQYINHYVFTYLSAQEGVVFDYLLKNYQHVPEISYILGKLYLQSGKRDLANYFIWKASTKHYQPAINAMGDWFYTDKQDIKNAVQYYKKAANMGYGPAQFNLGIVYLKHYKNYRLAYTFLAKAAQNRVDFCSNMRKAAAQYADIAKSSIK